jgi:hypothetical protein
MKIWAGFKSRNKIQTTVLNIKKMPKKETKIRIGITIKI